MNKTIFLLIAILFPLTAMAAEKGIVLPAVPAKIGMDVIQAMESRAGVRHYDGNAVSLESISTILWAGYGIIYKNGNKTIHGFDAVSGATDGNMFTIPIAWGKSYIRLYLLLENGAYEYLPEKHMLKIINTENLIQKGGSSAKGTHCAVVIAADFDNMLGGKKGMARDVAFMSAGAAAQNMIVAGAASNVQMLIQVSIKHNGIKKGLNLPKNIEPLALLPFGYVK